MLSSGLGAMTVLGMLANHWFDSDEAAHVLSVLRETD
jgi:hypothetical protein